MLLGSLFLDESYVRYKHPSLIVLKMVLTEFHLL